MDSGRIEDITLYTGNDDHIVGDLLTDVPGAPGGFVGGLLGQWSVWTSEAVRTVELARAARSGDVAAWQELRALEVPLAEANGAIFDVANGFRGSVPGIHEVLRRQGLLDTIDCLDPDEVLSPGQRQRIDLIWRRYPQLRDDRFIAEHLDRWLS